MEPLGVALLVLISSILAWMLGYMRGYKAAQRRKDE